METLLIILRLSMARRKNRSRSTILEEALRQFLGGAHLAHSGADMTCARLRNGQALVQDKRRIVF
jgi:predicted transcriptional regulator